MRWSGCWTPPSTGRARREGREHPIVTASAGAEPSPLRRTAGDRRAQLVQIGLELLPTTPVQELTIDEVARRAGISRSLLFHYFATKRDYYTAVTRAAADLFWAHLLPRVGTPQAEQVAGMLDRYVGWVEAYRETHLSFVRGAAGGDPWLAEVYAETRGRLGDVALRALGLPDDVLRRQLVLAWFAFTEDLVGQWVREPRMTRTELLALLRDVLDRLVAS
jgi:AcrR family transcriptional regulator